MIRFARAFPSAEIVSTLRRQLSWSHFKQLIYMEDELKRTFYAEMCREEGWSTRVLAERIDGMLFERTALSKKPDALIRASRRRLQKVWQLAGKRWSGGVHGGDARSARETVRRQERQCSLS